MSALHELAKQVFRTYIIDNDEIDLMREAMRLMQPIGTCADDEQVLVTALANARAADKPDSSAFWDLHAVNSHAENIWRDYYVLHRRRLDELVHAYLTAESSSASSTSGSFSDAGSLSAASSPPTSVEDTSDAEDKGLDRSRQPSAAPEECSAFVAPSRASRATSPIRSPSPAVIPETQICWDHMDVFPVEDRASYCDADQEAFELYPVVDATALAPCAEVGEIPAELYSEPMEEDIIENEAVIQHSPQSSPAPSARSPFTRFETPPSSSSSISSNDFSSPQTPSTPRSSRSVSGSPRRSERERKPKKRPDEAGTRFPASKPSSTASGSSAGSTSQTKANRTSSSPVQSKFVYTMDEEMGRAGGKATLGDLRACARFLAENPDVASMKRDARGKAFYKLHPQPRTVKSWSHIFSRFETTIADLAEAYRLSNSSS
ncbi:hypothetical protein PENSPDRAFT_278990 [Peniophora sp. CONT]|nr:hypothetical protein PENSPDRAFT_278990 [Peniophora sp. CONT]